MDTVYWHCITCPAELYAAADTANKDQSFPCINELNLGVTCFIPCCRPILTSTEWKLGPDELWSPLSIDYFMILYNTS